MSADLEANVVLLHDSTDVPEFASGGACLLRLKSGSVVQFAGQSMFKPTLRREHGVKLIGCEVACPDELMRLFPLCQATQRSPAKVGGAESTVRGRD
jgi:hypothetical protein